MPCTDGSTHEDHMRELRSQHERQNRVAVKENAFMRAMLCGALSALEELAGSEEQALAYIEWAEVGIEQERGAKWWRAHKEHDKIRKAEEAAQKKAIMEQVEALDKAKIAKADPRNAPYKWRKEELEAVSLTSGIVVRPKGQMGTCGWHPAPWEIFKPDRRKRDNPIQQALDHYNAKYYRAPEEEAKKP
jgi:hypothetical protein